MQINQLKSQG